MRETGEAVMIKSPKFTSEDYRTHSKYKNAQVLRAKTEGWSSALILWENSDLERGGGKYLRKGKGVHEGGRRKCPCREASLD